MSHTNILVPFKGPSHDHWRCIRNALAVAEKTCASRGLRLTKLRRRVLELIWDRHEPAKAYDILEQLRQEHQAAAPPTVYRALDFLLQTGLIHRVETLNAYVGCGDPDRLHIGQFLLCRRCGTVAELDAPEITGIITREAKYLGFRVDRQTVEIRGLCPQCSGD
ncbi:Ferric-uptake regulator [Nitrosococcus oceani ATCC 19707]|uniref:Ferric uptake regulation protein n=2 Tax=Nitrosococcus oceani TaxID=1229 RepID=Q3J8G6_NITOC|nr:Fur family transcriptional regulator [Nitrosococcus oceani]ABA58880.1 Ferric-uptake regulator [Nitrosococcus oceani ATCC 19707]EDZ67828.1 transcriptional regulator, Fur family [Nitrosococcus oceani AFC27]KFI18679.1 Fur family transcriptional regulator [Nitrosococcus oceani C-27]GEM19028.1 transcriptional repressor [Nitrosococcus oceani]